MPSKNTILYPIGTTVTIDQLVDGKKVNEPVLIIGTTENGSFVPYLGWVDKNSPLRGCWYPGETNIRTYCVPDEYKKEPAIIISGHYTILGISNTKIGLRPEGCSCIICKEYSKWAAPNRPDGKFLCHRCKPHEYLLSGNAS